VGFAMQIEHQAQDWNELARLDPHWAILTAPGKRFGRWDSDEFFATGTAEARAFIGRAEALGLPRERGRALDFGCGLGRMTRALAEHFDDCIGIDISHEMVRGARQANADVAGVTFEVNEATDLRRFDDATFDLVYSMIVLQHVPDRAAIESYVREFCRVLRPGGLAVFQLPTHIPAIFRLQWRRKLYLGLRRAGVSAPVLYRRLHLLPIAMSYIPEADMIRVVESQGARMVTVDRQRAVGLMNTGLTSSTYYVTR
jgi:ubiquinone/menaquinone biosynthesis C-methylase UbiE